jgi:sulfate transport system permease protein
VLVRYRFPGKAVPRRPGRLSLRAAHRGRRPHAVQPVRPNGWLGQFLAPLGIQGAFTPLGVIIALTFVGLPFVVRTLQPVLEDFERETEEAAATLGAGRLRTFVTVIAPSLLPALSSRDSRWPSRGPSGSTAR